jgi:hypothetical protein
MISCSKGKVLGCKAGNLDLCVFKGDSFNEEINWVRDVNGKEVPVKLRGYSATMDFISAHNSKNELVLRLESPTGIFLDNNKIVVNIPFQVVENFNWVKSNYRLIMTSPQGIKQTILRGRFTIIGSSPECCS